MKQGPATGFNKVESGKQIRDDFPIVDTPGYKGAIVPAEEASKNAHLAERFDGFWTPTTNQIAKAEAKIGLFLEKSADKLDPLHSYEAGGGGCCVKTGG